MLALESQSFPGIMENGGKKTFGSGALLIFLT